MHWDIKYKVAVINYVKIEITIILIDAHLHGYIATIVIMQMYNTMLTTGTHS